MKEITSLMVNEFKLKELGMDMMGYKIDRVGSLQFHHLVVPKRDCKRMPSFGYIRSNGAILTPTSHEYLHRIENYERELFLLITKELIDENLKGYVDIDNLIAIRNYLEIFEREYEGMYTKKGSKVVKTKYKMMRKELNHDGKTRSWIKNQYQE